MPNRNQLAQTNIYGYLSDQIHSLMVLDDQRLKEALSIQQQSLIQKLTLPAISEKL
ncbi:MAG: hypothetical protein F6K11_08910 [Leptolyngbya sp. SIO3F4]|nr:hypothetical protein [Leptolyngbya sp. SIO3F4]